MTQETFQKAADLYAYLLKYHQLERDDDRTLYQAYVEDLEVQKAVKRLGAAAQFDLALYGNTIYLIPQQDNTTFGYTRSELKNRLVGSNASYEAYNLAMFIILVFLMECYDANGETSAARDFMKEEELEDLVEQYLREGSALYSEEEEKKMGISFHKLYEHYNALSGSESLGAKVKTKEGFISKIMSFLSAQQLVDYVREDHIILLTPKLNAFMDFDLLNRTNYDRVEAMFETIKEEHHE